MIIIFNTIICSSTVASNVSTTWSCLAHTSILLQLIKECILSEHKLSEFILSSLLLMTSILHIQYEMRAVKQDIPCNLQFNNGFKVGSPKQTKKKKEKKRKKKKIPCNIWSIANFKNFYIRSIMTIF